MPAYAAASRHAREQAHARPQASSGADVQTAASTPSQRPRCQQWSQGAEWDEYGAVVQSTHLQDDQRHCTRRVGGRDVCGQAMASCSLPPIIMRRTPGLRTKRATP